MAVFRLERTRDYTVMSNHHLRDKRLSLKAKGLLSQMLSLPDDWDYTLSGLAYINRESKDAIRSAVNELERAGYVQRHQTTNASGKFSVNEYIIYERPVSGNPSPEKPSSDNPTPGKPLQDIQMHCLLLFRKWFILIDFVFKGGYPMKNRLNASRTICKKIF